MGELPDIKTDFAEWYNEVVYAAELADHAPVRGSLVIRPYGYQLWELIRNHLDERLKATGHSNAAFPLLIPESFLKKEAEHVEGFAPELAVVTYAGGKKLEDPLVIRPTSETLIHYMFAKWIKSWRDLPLKINQWANVVRWEMRTRPFLRTTEFFWQEGHTAHETESEARDEVLLMLNEYVDLAEQWLAIPVVKGLKSVQEKFPGAIETYTFEAFMPDGKALQMGTSHLLSQTFAHAFDMKFQNKEGELCAPHLTSWGTTTRLVGAVVMAHGDQKGLVLPPKVAPIQVVILPIFKKNSDPDLVMDVVEKVRKQLQAQGIRLFVDDDQSKSAGNKFYHWELRGVPIRLEIGPRDVASQQVMAATRLGHKEPVPAAQLSRIGQMLDEIQSELFKRAQQKMVSMRKEAGSISDFKDRLDQEASFYHVGWCKSKDCENELKKYKATIRCLIDDAKKSHCFFCAKSSATDVLVAKSY